MSGFDGATNPGVGPTIESAELPDTAITPGSYTATDLTVDQKGRITAAANGTAGIGGSTGATDNALLAADGTGGATLQSRAAKISDAGILTLTGGSPVVEIGDGSGDKLTYTAGSGPRFINADDVALVLVISGLSASRNVTIQDAAGTIALTANKLSDFAATTSSELAGVISDETGSGGGFVRATSPTITTPTIGGARCIGFTTTAGAPTTTEYPNDKDFGFHKNSTTGVVTVTFNDGGVIKVIALA